jgi:flagellar biosynthetic protein FliQ
MLTLLLGTPILAAALITGLIVSVFQATTQINELTLTFVPKIAAIFAVLVIAGPWMLSTLLTYAAGLFGNLATFAR